MERFKLVAIAMKSFSAAFGVGPAVDAVFAPYARLVQAGGSMLGNMYRLSWADKVCATALVRIRRQSGPGRPRESIV